jgi:hypothetical protein
MSIYSASRRVNGSDHPLDGRLGSYYQGLVPQVPRVTGYDPKIRVRPVPSSDKQLGNHTLSIRYNPSLLAEEEGPPTSNRTKPRSNPRQHVPLIFVAMGMQDLTTC